MGSFARSQARKMERKGNQAGITPGNASAMLGQLVAVAQHIDEMRPLLEQIPAIVPQIDAAREAAAVALEEFARFEYEVTKQRFVSLRLHYYLMFGDSDWMVGLDAEGRLSALLEVEEQFRAEYDAIQALVILTSKHVQ